MKLNSLIINKLIDDGFLIKNEHPSLPIFILNYSRKTQFEKYWNEYTLLARGLVLDFDYNVVAYPFRKFFNFEEHQVSDIPKESYEVYDKMDGSLGILFNYGFNWHLATRGSFVSDQAIRAKEILKKYNISELNPENTYLFEIIYPENRIVVNYGEEEKLMLLGVVDNASGYDYTYDKIVNHLEIRNCNLPLVKKYEDNHSVQELKARNILNQEGYILRFYPSNFRMKVKFEDYCRLHSIITNISTKDIWMFLRDGKDLNELLERTPDEFDEWVNKQVQTLKNEYLAMESHVDHVFTQIYREGMSKKEFAELAFKSEVNASILFKMFEKNSYAHIIWKMIEPKWSKPFFKQDDEGYNLDIEKEI